MVTDACHILARSGCQQCRARPSRVRTLPAAFSKFILYLPACHVPQGPQHISLLHCITHSHHAVSSISLSSSPFFWMFPTAFAFISHFHPPSPLSSQTPRDTPHLSSCSSFKLGSLSLPLFLVDSDSSSTRDNSNPDFLIRNTSHPLSAYSSPVQSCLMHSSGLYVLCKVFPFTVYTNLEERCLPTTCRQFWKH